MQDERTVAEQPALAANHLGQVVGNQREAPFPSPVRLAALSRRRSGRERDQLAEPKLRSEGWG